MVERIRREIGEPNVLINNAGTGALRFVDETPAAEVQEMMAVPYLAAFNLTRLLVPAMVRTCDGHVINVTSVACFRAMPGATAYVASCWALRGFTEALRADLSGLGIGVTLLAAGTSTTPGYDHYPGVVERMPRITRIVPLLSPDVVARAIVRAIERNRRTVILPWPMLAIVLLDRFCPWLVEWLVVRRVDPKGSPEMTYQQARAADTRQMKPTIALRGAYITGRTSPRLQGWDDASRIVPLRSGASTRSIA